MDGVITTAFFMHCWRSARLELSGLLACVWMAIGLAGAVHAQVPEAEIIQLTAEPSGDALLLSASVRFELSTALEDALQKGVPLIFVAEAQLTRERWYWTNRKVASAERHLRLSYQPLTRRWRLTIASGQMGSADLGMALNQNFDTLATALAAVQRVSRWKIAEVAVIESGQKHRLDFNFRLDTSQLPRPLQIGTLGQSEWSISTSASRPVVLEVSK